MIEEIMGEAGWPAALVLVVALAIWGFNVHEDRTNAHEIDKAIIEECGHYETAKAVAECGDRIKEAL